MSATAIRQAKRWYWQRISAMVLTLCVVGHLAAMIHAVRGGLTGEEILSRTQGSIGFGVFYTVFVLACAVHVPAGVTNIAVEWLGLSDESATWLGRAFALLLVVTGLRAVFAVVAA